MFCGRIVDLRFTIDDWKTGFNVRNRQSSIDNRKFEWLLEI